MTDEERRKKQEEEAQKRALERQRRYVQLDAQRTSKTKAPSGLSIKRNNDKFTCGWKIADADYADGQTFRYYLNKKKVTSQVATVKTTSKVIDVDVTKFHPSRLGTYLTRFGFEISGNRKKYKTKKSGFEIEINPPQSTYTQLFFSINEPYKPSVSVALSSTLNNVSTFTWSVTNDTTSSYWARGVQWESIILRECNTALPPETAWRSTALGYQSSSGNYIGTMSGSKEITEDTTEMLRGSFTRWFRVRSRGPAGDSAWAYEKHVYALPYAARITSAAVKTTTSGGYTCSVRWIADSNLAHPIDATTVQYVFVTPDAGLQCPDSASWRDAIVLRDTAGTDGATFSIDSQVGTDQCLFVRVNTEHDKKGDYGTTHGLPVMVAAGPLTMPTNLNVSLNQETMLATVSATNASAVPDALISVRYYTAQNPNGTYYSTIPKGEASVTVQLPIADRGKDITIGVCAYVSSGGVVKMISPVNKAGGNIPVAPASVEARMTDTVGTVQVTWEWTWQEATSAELSWADHEDAWESTSEPSTYAIDNTHVGRWNISGLETGKTWYIRVRLATGTGDNLSYGAYSEIVSIDLSSAPSIPVLALSSGVITDKGRVTASWTYTTSDGTHQSYAEVAEVVNGEYTLLATTHTAQHVTLDAEQLGWQTGTSHRLAVRVTSASGRKSDWSDIAAVAIADPITATIASTSLVSKTVEEDGSTRSFMALTVMPFTVTVTGAGGGGTTSIIIERAASYHVSRPDETEFNGFEGESIAYRTYRGEGEQTFTLDDLIGHLDDGAKYRIVATCNDSLGQSASAELEFEVMWEHQAIIPSATAELTGDDIIVILTPVAPEGTLETDTCDIYRLSVDPPELIYADAQFGTKYVDPFPALGEFGGHRIVFKTANGDYITEDNQFAWVDLGENEDDILEYDCTIIDFGEGRLVLDRNLDISNKWAKDFTQTQYLGGSVQGDWNPAVERTATVSTVAVSILDQNVIQNMRRLAVYSGICHVRTNDGSSYAANIDVSENYSHSNARKVITFELTITRVDPEGMDGMTLAEWEEVHPKEENTEEETT